MAATIFDLLACHFGQFLVHTLLKRLVKRAHHPLQLQLLEPALGDRPHKLNAIQVWPVGYVPEHVNLLPVQHLRGDLRSVDAAVVQQDGHWPAHHLRTQTLHELAEVLRLERRRPPLEQDEPISS